VEALGRENKEAALFALAGMARRWSRGQGPPVATDGTSLLPGDKLLELANTTSLDWSFRSRAIALLAFVPTAHDELIALSAPSNEQRVRMAAIGALSNRSAKDTWMKLIDGFSADTPPIRRAIIDGLLANAERTKLLLDAIEKGRIKASEIDLAQAKRLTGHRDAAIKERAGQLFEAATPADRAAALADYQQVLQMSGDPQRGRVVFEKTCTVCHRIAGIGVNVAPDISDSRTKKPDQLLADIIQPNRAIDNNYIGYTVRLVDGTIATGILTAETATSITLRQQEGKDAVIPRDQIEELRSSGQSLMPEGLEKQIPPQEMADLISFIKNWRYLDGRTPLSTNGP
jgi:putative heme-binding domain-containing protein